MSYSVIDWGAFTPSPFDETLDLASIYQGVKAGRPSDSEVYIYYQTGLNGALMLHDVYDPTGEHPARFTRLEEEVKERMAQYEAARDDLERFLVADRLMYQIGIAYDAYEAKFGPHVEIRELLRDGSYAVGAGVGAIVVGAVAGVASEVPSWVWWVAGSLAVGSVAVVAVVIIRG